MDARDNARKFVRDLRRIVGKNDSLIYEFHVGGQDDFDDDDPFALKALRCFSSGATSVSKWVKIRAFNASGNDILSADDAAFLGREYDVEINTYQDSVEVHAEFDY